MEEAEKMAREWAIKHECNVCETCEQVPQEDRIARDEYAFLAGFLAGQQSRWVSVKERLPEEEGRYVVTYNKGKAIKQRLWIADWFENRWSSQLPDVDITHFMEITLPTEEIK